MAYSFQDELDRLIHDGILNADDANRLLLAQVRVLSDRQEKVILKLDTVLENQKKRSDDLRDRLEAIEEFNRDYPPLSWIAVHKTKLFIFLLTIFVVGILVIGTPWNVSDVRIVILDLVGLDPSLGLHPNP